MAWGGALSCNWRGPLALQSPPEFWLCPRTFQADGQVGNWACPDAAPSAAVGDGSLQCLPPPPIQFPPSVPMAHGPTFVASGETESLFLWNRSPSIFCSHSHPDLENKRPLGSACPHHRECGVFLKGAEGKLCLRNGSIARSHGASPPTSRLEYSRALFLLPSRAPSHSEALGLFGETPPPPHTHPSFLEIAVVG